MRLTFAFAQLFNILTASFFVGALQLYVGSLENHFPRWLVSLPKLLQIILTLFFGILIGEVHLANRMRSISIKMMKVREKSEDYADLSADDKLTVTMYWNAKEKCDKHLMVILQVESSVQLILYLVKLLFELFDPPVLELNYGPMSVNQASMRWILLILLLLVKTAMSGLSTFKPILALIASDSYNKTGESPTLLTFGFVIFKMLADVLFATVVTFLVRKIFENPILP